VESPVLCSAIWNRRNCCTASSARFGCSDYDASACGCFLELVYEETGTLESTACVRPVSARHIVEWGMAETAILERSAVLRHGRKLEYFTIAWNTLEGLVAVIAGAMAGSISLVGFGIDSFIEVTSGSVLLWRMSVDSDVHRRETNEKRALRFVGACFLFLAAYIAYDSILDLWSKRSPEQSISGIVLACVSLVVMPLLSRAKRRVGRAMGSAAMHADAKQTEFCTYLSAILLVGLMLNAFLGWWWSDPLAALIMVPIITKEGIDGVRGRACANCCTAATTVPP
jgi:hypothetical protein